MDEILVGWTKDISGDLSIRTQARYRKGDHFWEDVPNNIYLHANPRRGTHLDDALHPLPL